MTTLLKGPRLSSDALTRVLLPPGADTQIDKAFGDISRYADSVGKYDIYDEQFWRDYILTSLTHRTYAPKKPRLSYSTVRINMFCVDGTFRYAGVPSPVTPDIWTFLRGCRGIYARPQIPQRPITLTDIDRIVAVLDPHDIRDISTAALILFSFECAQRSSEMLRLFTMDLIFFEGRGYIVIFGRAKNHRTNTPRPISVAYAQDPKRCPVLWMQRWLRVLGDQPGAVFRSFRHGTLELSDHAMSSVTANDIIKRAASRAGIDPIGLSMQSMRRGRLTAGASVGHDTPTLLRRSQHRNDRNLGRYVDNRYLDHSRYDKSLDFS